MFGDSKAVGCFTDGSCFYRDRIGSWAWIAFDETGLEVWDAAAVHDTTNNRMEMTAAIKALTSLSDDFGKLDVLIWCDSEYVVLGCQDPTRSRKKNTDLWHDLNKAISLHDSVGFIHVKGHEDSHYNIFVDKLAGQVRKEAANVNI